MGHEFAVALTLGLLAGASALRTSSNATANSLDSTAAEVGRRCKTSDFAGAMSALERYGAPVGADHAKELIKACFMGNDGECQAGETQCAWMQRCLAVDGPCERPPIVDMLSEIPGGKAALSLAQIATGKTGQKSDQTFQVGLLVDAIKKVFDSTGLAHMQLPGTEDAKWEAINKMAAKIPDPKEKQRQRWANIQEKVTNMKIPDKTKYQLWLMKGAHDVWLDYFPDQKKALWIYKLGALGLNIMLTCATEYTNSEGKKIDGYEVMMRGVTNKAPIYAWFAPKGLFKSPAYVYPILKTKTEKDAKKWKC